MSSLRDINEMHRGSVSLHETDHRAKQFVRLAQILAMHSENLPAARAYA